MGFAEKERYKIDEHLRLELSMNLMAVNSIISVMEIMSSSRPLQAVLQEESRNMMADAFQHGVKGMEYSADDLKQLLSYRGALRDFLHANKGNPILADKNNTMVINRLVNAITLAVPRKLSEQEEAQSR